jgi:hypothetical protein
MLHRVNVIFATCLMVLSLSGCSLIEPMTKFEKVQPWQKGTLAKRQMALEGDAIDSYVDEHIYFSKEATTGGTGVGGGGCGCN